MRPIEITATAFRSWERISVRFQEGCTAIVGENGHGKSSILLAIEAALFGTDLPRRLNWDGASTELEATLVFEHAGAVYRARRHYSARGRGKTWLDLETRNEAHDVWIALTCATTGETQAALERIIGFGIDTFRASAWLAQRGASFTTAKARDRKQILAEILNLDLWPRLQERATADRKAAEETLSRLVARREQIQGDLAFQDETRQQHAAAIARIEKARTERDDLDKGLDDLRHRIAAFVEARGAADAATVRLHELMEQVAREDAAIVRADETIRACMQQLAERETLEQQAWRVPDLQRQVDEMRAQYQARIDWAAERDRIDDEAERGHGEHDRAYAAVDKLKLALADRELDLHALEHEPDATCQTCGQPVADDARARAIAAARALVDETSRQLDEASAALTRSIQEGQAIAARREALAEPPLLPAPLSHYEAQLAAAQEARVKLAALAETQTRLDEATYAKIEHEAARARLADQREQARAAEAAARAELTAHGNHAELEQRARTARNLLAQHNARVEQAVADAARWQARLDQLAEQEALLPGIQAEHDDTLRTLRAARELERAYGPNGIPALILETTAIPALEHDASRLLRDLGLDRRVELRTQTQLKTRDGLKDALEIAVITPTGAECLYEDLSGGELTRLDLALRVALARLIARRPGAEVGILALDEPEGLDEHGRRALAEILRGLDEFPVRVIVSHHGDLRDAFDQAIVVERGPDGLSRVAGHHAEPEPIAA